MYRFSAEVNTSTNWQTTNPINYEADVSILWKAVPRRRQHYSIFASDESLNKLLEYWTSIERLERERDDQKASLESKQSNVDFIITIIEQKNGVHFRSKKMKPGPDVVNNFYSSIFKLCGNKELWLVNSSRVTEYPIRVLYFRAA